MSIVSASQAFIEWLQASVSRLTGISGSMEVRHYEHAHSVWKLRYGKAHSRLLSERFLPLPETREGRTLSVASRSCIRVADGTTEGRLAVQC